jgi:hypothetical protein
MLRGQIALTVFAVLLIWSVADGSGATVAIDFEESPVPDLTTITNHYHGESKWIYAFLVVKGESDARSEEYVSSFDLGYRLISRDSSVINHGFHRMPGWQPLDPEGTGTPGDVCLPGSRLPAAVGYWKLELRNARCSRGELQLVPNPENRRRSVTLTDGLGNSLEIPSHELSQDVKSHGLINLTYYSHSPSESEAIDHVHGQVLAHFMHGVIEMDGRVGDLSCIADPGLRRVARDFGLVRITRLFRNSARRPDLVLSRTGELMRPADKWDIYLLDFSDEEVLADVVDAILSLPRCVDAGPHATGDLTSPMSFHMPNDPLAQPDSAWHLYRINMPDAWDFGGTGYPTTRVGVADYGLDYHLEDFGAAYGPGWKVAGGWDYGNDDDDPARAYGDDFSEIYEHGNWTSSVLGALANDSLGIAGVAGGWGGIDEEIGPSLYHFKVRQDSGGFWWGWMSEAIADAGALYGCDVLSVSFAAKMSGSTRRTLKLAVYDCYKSGTVLVSGLGNDDSTVTMYPGCFREDWVLCLQGSSRHPKDADDDIPERRISGKDPLYSPPYFQWGANWPDAKWPIPYTAPDVSAPASHMCVLFSDSLWVGDELRKPYYMCEGSGVSYAIPLVAGTAGLMLGNNPLLSVRDVEGLVSASCTDILTDYEVTDTLRNWDKFSGWGRINADSCIMFCGGSWNIEDHTVSGGGFVVDTSPELETMTFYATDVTKPLSGQFLARRHEVRRAITPPQSDAAPFVWGVPCEGSGWGYTCQLNDSARYRTDDFNLQEPFCGLVPSSQYAPMCTLYSFVYEVYLPPEGLFLGWFPEEPGNLDWGYSGLVRCACSVTSGDTVRAGSTLSIISAAPNPTRRDVLVSFVLPADARVSLKVFDVRGREVRTILDGSLEAGVHKRKWDGLDNSGRLVAPGVYYCRVSTASQSDMRKTVFARGGK